MSYLWSRDERIEENTALRDLEKKVHFLMSVVCANELATSGTICARSTDDVEQDASEVFSQAPKT